MTQPARDSGRGIAPALIGGPEPIICLITDRHLADPLDRAISAAVAGGVNMVQLREKDLMTRDLLTLAQKLMDLVEDRALLIVNGRSDIAVAVGADGVHLPADGLPTSGVRRVLGARALIGRSVHGLAEVEAAQSEGLDYLELGTIHPSGSHPGGATLGLEPLRVAASNPLPVLAVGGITPENVRAVIGAGAAGVAVISAVLGGDDPRGAAERLCAAAASAWEERGAIPT